MDVTYKVVFKESDRKFVRVSVDDSVIARIFKSYKNYPWRNFSGKPRGYVLLNLFTEYGRIKADSRVEQRFDRENVCSLEIHVEDKGESEKLANNSAKLFNLPLPF